VAEIKEVEKIPEGWRRVRLGEVSEVVKEISKKGSYPYLEIGDIDIYSKKYTIKEKTSPEHCLKAKKGNIVMSKVRPTRGAISKIKEEVLYISPALLVLNSQNNNFLLYSLSRKVFFDHLGKRETGTTYPSVNDMDILDFELNYPPLPEQRKIAEILETVDNAIEKTDRVIEKYKRIRQGLMQDLLACGIDENGQIRSEETHKFKDSPLGRIPEEWEVVRLGEVANINPEKVDYSITHQIKYIDIDSVSEYKILSYKTFSPKNAPSRAQRLVRENDVIISTVRPNLKAFSIITKQFDNFVCSTGFAVLRSKDNKILPAFLFYISLYDDIFLKQILPMVVGSNYPAINSSRDVNRIQIPIPPLPEQQCIASILSQIDEAIEKEQKYNEKLERTKRGLMEDLLTGKVRVNHMIFKEVKV